DVEEVAGTQVIVARRIARVDRAHRDPGRHARIERVLAGHDLSAEVREPAANLADHRVANREADLGMQRVDGPGARGVAPNRSFRGDGHVVLPCCRTDTDDELGCEPGPDRGGRTGPGSASAGDYDWSLPRALRSTWIACSTAAVVAAVLRTGLIIMKSCI